MNLYKKIDAWLKLNYQPLNNWIYFNATPSSVGSVAMNTVPGDNIIRKYIDGSIQKEIIFSIDMISEYDSSGTSEVNILALDEVDNFITWLQEQKDALNYPDFGNTNIIEDMQVLTNTPSLLINSQDMLSKYQFQCKIIYKDIKEVL